MGFRDVPEIYGFAFIIIKYITTASAISSPFLSLYQFAKNPFFCFNLYPGFMFSCELPHPLGPMSLS
jgi:hypothetical protein